MEFRDLKKQYQILKPKIDEAVIRAMTDCDFISGAPVKDLEAILAEYVGVKHCITCANGTDALSLALMAYGIGPGDAVFVPDFTFFSTAETPAALGATPVFVDVDSDTYNIDASKLEKAIRLIEHEGKLHPRAIITVDLFGQCADYESIRMIAEEHSLLIIEDGAQGFGGQIGNKRACSFGDISTTSFFPAKPLGCYGDGGAVFTNDDEAAELVRSFAVHGKGTQKYDNVRIGMNSRLDTIQAAILLVKLDAFIKYELEDINSAADIYSNLLKDVVKIPYIKREYYSSWAQYTIQLNNAEQRQAVQIALKEQQIPTMVYYQKGMHQQIAFKNVNKYTVCPVTERLCNTVLSLPIHPYMTEKENQDVVLAIRRAVK